MHRALFALHVVGAVALLATFAAVARGRERRGLVRVYAALVAAAATNGLAGGYLPVAPPDLAYPTVVVRDVFRFLTIGVWAAVVLRYTGQWEDLGVPPRALAGGYLLLTVVPVLTDPLHGLAYPAFVEGVHGSLRPVRGPAYWVGNGTLHLVYVVVIGLLARRLFTAGYLEAGESVAIAAMFFVPFAVDFTALVVLVPAVGFEVTPLFVLAFGTVTTVVFARYDLFDVDPVSRNAVLDGTEDALVVVRNGRVVDHNAAARPLFDADVDDPLGRPADEVFRVAARSNLPTFDPDTGGPLSDGAAEPGEVEIDANGERRYYDPTVTASAGAVDATVLTFRDVTALKRKERELERKNERLETFTGTVAHDLRNPLSVARGYLDVAPEDDAVERAEDAVDRMEAMVENLLELARQGRAVGETEPVALADAASDAWDAVDTADTTLTVASDRRVEADADRLGDLLANLFRNAVEHAGPEVRVTVGATDDGFYVADDGPGIPEDERDDVFDHGYTTADDGTGFGLSIVGEIAAAHGWDVTVGESDTGGARFDITGVEPVGE